MFDILSKLKERFLGNNEATLIAEIDYDKTQCSVCGGQPANRRIRGRRDVHLCRPCKKSYHRELKVALHGA